MYFSTAGGWTDVPVYSRDHLETGHKIFGPAIIEQLDATTVLPPNDLAEIDEWTNIRIHIDGARTQGGHNA